MSEIDNTQSSGDVSQESSSPTPSESANNESQSASPGQSNPNNDSSFTGPFHEHPRFKELIEQRNKFSEHSQQLQRRLEQLEQQVSKPAPQEAKADPLLERLKQIDPEFGGKFAELVSKLSQVDSLSQKWQDYESAQLYQAATSQLASLHEQNKVPAEMRELYDMQVQKIAAADPRLGLKDLPVIYKQVHDRMTKVQEGIRRAERESYVAGKKADSNIPTTQTRGQTAKPTAKKDEWSKNPDDAKRQLIDRVVQSVRAQKQG